MVVKGVERALARRRGAKRLTALLRAAIVGVLAPLVGIALFPCAIAVADTVESNFENPPFHTGSVNKQDGWRSAAPGEVSAAFCKETYPVLKGQYDQEVLGNGGGIPGFGNQSLRMSNACGTGDFTEQMYSKPNTEPAGEKEANKEFVAQFSFVTTKTTPQPGLDLNVSPTDAGGARLSWVGLIETEEGTQVAVSECCEITPVGEPLKRGVPHTIKLWMKLNPGSDNDFVRFSIDGKDVGQCFPSWENYYRGLEPSEEPKPIDQLIFRSRLTEPSLLGQGYLFDNVSSTTANRAGPPACEMPIEKQADKRTVGRGGRVNYRITVHNRGGLIAHDYRVCDHIPQGMTFVSADRKLARIGAQRCLVIPSLAPGRRFSFHVELRADANAPPGNADNIAEEKPVGPPGSPPVPPAAAQDLPGKTGVASAVSRAEAIVKIVAKWSARRPAPPVTG